MRHLMPHSSPDKKKPTKPLPHPLYYWIANQKASAMSPDSAATKTTNFPESEIISFTLVWFTVFQSFACSILFLAARASRDCQQGFSAKRSMLNFFSLALERWKWPVPLPPSLQPHFQLHQRRRCEFEASPPLRLKTSKRFHRRTKNG